MLLNSIATSPSASATLVLIAAELGVGMPASVASVSGGVDTAGVAGFGAGDAVGFGVVAAGFLVCGVAGGRAGSLRATTAAGCASFMSIRSPTRSVSCAVRSEERRV